MLELGQYDLNENRLTPGLSAIIALALLAVAYVGVYLCLRQKDNELLHLATPALKMRVAG